MHKVLQRLQREFEDPESLITRASDDQRKELHEMCDGCERVLKVVDSIICKYNTLSEDKRSGKRLWQKVRFGNGEMQDLSEIRSKLSSHTSAINLSMNLCFMGSQGRVEKELNNLGGDLQGIRWKVDWIAANIAASSGEGTVWTSYADDDRGFWRELRRGLIKDGYGSSVLHRHKHLIKQYVEELGNRGIFDEWLDTNTQANRSMQRRTPEEQAAHEKQREQRFMRTPEEQAAHDKRKELRGQQRRLDKQADLATQGKATSRP